MIVIAFHRKYLCFASFFAVGTLYHRQSQPNTTVFLTIKKEGLNKKNPAKTYIEYFYLSLEFI